MSSTWPTLPLRRVGQVISGGTPSAEVDNWDGNVPFVTPPDMRVAHGSVIGKTDRTLTNKGAREGSSIAPPGAILVSIRAPIGYVATIQEASAFNQGCRALVPTGAYSARFVSYAMQGLATQFESLGRGTTFMEVSAAQFAAFEVPVPDLLTQTVIADYLDRETAQIDALIEKQHQLIATLRERHLAAVSHALQISSATRQTSIRSVLLKLSRPARPGLGVLTAYRNGEVTLRSLRRDAGYTISNTEDGYQEVRPGDLVFHALDGFAGAVGISDSQGNATPVYHVCSARYDDHLPYLAVLLRHLGTSGFLAAQAPNVRERSIDFRNWSTFARVPLSLPNPDEQRARYRALSRSDARTRRLTTDSERLIALAQERRSALITAAVTGQIDIRSVA